ncbi:MAG: glycosyltransferase family 4 protein [Candidatus Eisenbacteria bacterium]
MSLSVFAMVPYPPDGASARYRAYQMVTPLAALGVRMEVRSLLDGPGFGALYRHGSAPAKLWHLARGCRRRWAELAEAGRYDLAFVHRDLWPFLGDASLRRLAARQPRWVYDFDDSVWLPNVSEANRAFAWLKPTVQYARLAAGARGVAAGNAWLATWARAQRPGTDPADVSVIPTAVDTVRWAPRPRGDGPLRLTWIGSHSTVHYLDPLRPLLPGLARRHPDLELHVIGARFACDGVRVVEHEWSLDHEVEATARCDIGLAPLPDDPWSRGKCGLKLLLYMALGLPVVASNIGVQPEIVRDGINGRLAGTPVEFIDAVDALLASAVERRRLGAAARADVEAGYSVRAVAPRLATLFARAAG